MEIKAIIPGFEQIINKCDFNEEQLEICEKIGVNTNIAYRTGAHRNLRRFLYSWFNHPLSLVFIDKILVDEDVFFENFSKEEEEGRSSGSDFCDPESLGRWDDTSENSINKLNQVLEIYQDESKFYGTYDLNKLIDNNKKSFNEYLFSQIQCCPEYHNILEKNNQLDRKKREMYAPRWLCECYKISTVFFAQDILSDGKRDLPILDDDDHKKYYIDAIKSSNTPFYSNQFIDENETEINEFIEITNILAKELHPSPLLEKYRPEDIASKIIEMREKFDEPRSRLYDIYKISKHFRFEDKMSDRVKSELQVKKDRRSYLKRKIIFDIACGAIPIYDAYHNRSIDIHILPFFKCIYDLKEDLVEHRSLNWIGFFDKYSRL